MNDEATNYAVRQFMNLLHKGLGLLVSSAVILGQTGCVGSGGLNSKWAGNSQAKDDLSPDLAVKACLTVAQNLEKSGNESGAIEQYEKVAQLDPKNLQVTHKLALLYDHKADYVKSEAMFVKLAKAHPNDPEVLNDWGYSLYLRNNGGEAEDKLRLALKIAPQHARARANLGLVLGQQGRYDEALATFKEVVSDAEAHCNLAFVYWTQGHMEDARRECKAARQTEPNCKKAEAIVAALDRGEQRPPSRVAGGRPAVDRDALRQLAEKTVMPNRSKAGDQQAEDQVVYRSPNGVGWIPVPAKQSSDGPAVTSKLGAATE
jgi:Flp pilus assembly protein TadD